MTAGPETVGAALGPWRQKLADLGGSAGDLPEVDERAELAEERRRQAVQRAERFIPFLYQDARLTDLSDEDRSSAAKWLDSRSPTLLLVGNVGVGKTHAAYALARYAAEARSHRVACYHFSDALEALRPTGDARANADLRTCPLLVLDDLVNVVMTEWAVEAFGVLMDERTRRGLRQICTTNVTAAELRNLLGERTTSRLMGGAQVVKFTGPDRRQVQW